MYNSRASDVEGVRGCLTPKEAEFGEFMHVIGNIPLGFNLLAGPKQRSTTTQK